MDTDLNNPDNKLPMQIQPLINPSSNEYIDKLTLELLMNKSQYQKYVSKTDPKKHEEFQEHANKIRKYKHSILNLTTELLNDPYRSITGEVNGIFDDYVKTMIRYFECKEIENNYSNDDTLFDFDSKIVKNISPVDNPLPLEHSLWGNERVIKKKQSIFMSNDIF